MKIIYKPAARGMPFHKAYEIGQFNVAHMMSNEAADDAVERTGKLPIIPDMQFNREARGFGPRGC